MSFNCFSLQNPLCKLNWLTHITLFAKIQPIIQLTKFLLAENL